VPPLRISRKSAPELEIPPVSVYIYDPSACQKNTLTFFSREKKVSKEKRDSLLSFSKKESRQRKTIFSREKNVSREKRDYMLSFAKKEAGIEKRFFTGKEY
jgi:lipocalin